MPAETMSSRSPVVIRYAAATSTLAGDMAMGVADRDHGRRHGDSLAGSFLPREVGSAAGLPHPSSDRPLPRAVAPANRPAHRVVGTPVERTGRRPSITMPIAATGTRARAMRIRGAPPRSIPIASPSDIVAPAEIC